MAVAALAVVTKAGEVAMVEAIILNIKMLKNGTRAVANLKDQRIGPLAAPRCTRNLPLAKPARLSGAMVKIIRDRARNFLNTLSKSLTILVISLRQISESRIWTIS